MKPIIRRISIGAAAGAAASFPLIATKAVPNANLLLGVVIGAAFAAGLGKIRRAYAEATLAAFALGIPLWAFVTTASGVRRRSWGVPPLSARNKCAFNFPRWWVGRSTAAFWAFSPKD